MTLDAAIAPLVVHTVGGFKLPCEGAGYEVSCASARVRVCDKAKVDKYSVTHHRVQAQDDTTRHDDTMTKQCM